MAGAGGEGAPESASTTWAAAWASDCGGRHEAGGRLCPKWVLCHLAPLQGLAKAEVTLAARPGGADLTKGAGL